MADFGPIQVPPPGLLSLLNLKNTGRNPERMHDTYTPTLELRDMLLQFNLLDALKTLGGTPPGVNLTNGQVGARSFSPVLLQVPANEIWWVEEYTVRSVLPAAATEVNQFQAAYFTPLLGSLSTYAVGEASPVVTGVAAYSRQNVAVARGFWVPPTSEIGMLVNINDTATSIAYTGYCRYNPLRI